MAMKATILPVTANADRAATRYLERRKRLDEV